MNCLSVFDHFVWLALKGLITHLFLFHQSRKVSESLRMLIPQLTFTCSNSTIKPLEKSVKYVQS